MIRSYNMALLAGICAFTAFTSAANAESTLAFTGGSVTSDSYYVYAGGVTALNHDINKDGWLIRATGAFGGYDYDRRGSTRVDADVLAGDLMLGYQAFLGGGSTIKNIRLTGYLGGDYQDHDLSPNDTANPVRDSKGGVKGQAEVRGDFNHNITAAAIGNYSSAFDTYWSRVNVGYNFGKFIVGPEVLFMGSESYDQQRIGAFIGDITVYNSIKAGISGGYSHASRRGDSSAYGEFNLSTTF